MFDKPLNTRSFVLSLLLGAEPPALPARVIVGAATQADLAEATVRVALSRMVSAGDLLRDNSVYTLTPRLIDRQQRQNEAIAPHTVPWDGGWEVVVVTATGRTAAERGALRGRLARLRLAELREGIWMRPANLECAMPADLGAIVRRFTAMPESDPVDLARDLWDLDAWMRDSEELLRRMTGPALPADRFAAAAGAVRHLLADPVLPPALLPAGWPGGRLRDAYADYRRELLALHRDLATT